MREEGVAVGCYFNPFIISLLKINDAYRYFLRRHYLISKIQIYDGYQLLKPLSQSAVRGRVSSAVQSHRSLPKREKVGLMRLINNVVQAGFESGCSV